MPQVEPHASGERRRAPVSESVAPQDAPKISEVSGNVRVLCVDGLCIALVPRDRESTSLAEGALLLAMDSMRAPTGTILVSRRPAEVFSKDAVRRMAERGISVRYARTDDLVPEAQEMLASYWSRRKLIHRALMGDEGSGSIER